MAGNALPLVLLAGAAFFLSRKKGGTATQETEIPSDQGKGADETGSDQVQGEPVDEAEGFRVDWTFDPAVNMPWVESLEDYEAWTAQLEAGDDSRVWTGSLEFRDMDEQHAEIGIFVEEQMNAYGQSYGRTVDRAELDPEAKAAMEGSDLAIIEKGIGQTFDDVPGLDFLIFFMNDSLPLKMAILFVYDSGESQGASMSKMANFKSQWESGGIQVSMDSGFIGQQGPSLKEQIKAFLGANLPLKTQIGPGLLPTEASLNP